MAEPHWASYVGMATGIVGAFTGITGAIVSIVAYRRSTRTKLLELRLQLRKQAGDLREAHASLPDLLARADRSRKAVAAARGRFRSGMMERWNEEIIQDRETIGALEESIPARDETFEALNEKALESKLIEVHNLSRKVDRMKTKYDRAIAEDDNERDQISEDHRTGPTR